MALILAQVMFSVLSLMIPVVAIYAFKEYLKLDWQKSLLLELATLFFLLLAIAGHYGTTIQQGEFPSLDALKNILAISWFLHACIALYGKLLLKWAGLQLTEEDRQPNWTGFQSWSNAENVTTCLLVAVPFLLFKQDALAFAIANILSLFFVILYPLLNIMNHSGGDAKSDSVQSQQDDLQAKLKILDMLEQDKISPQECLELLKAMKTKRKKNGPELDLTKNVDKSSADCTAS